MEEEELIIEKAHKASDLMDHRSEDMEFVRSDGGSSVNEETFEKDISPVSEDNAGGGNEVIGKTEEPKPNTVIWIPENGEEEGDLPQCKIKRNYSCNLCPFFSQNPRSFLYHSRDVHHDRIKIFECSQCLYASKHSQKLQRHISMIHMSKKIRKIRNKMIRLDRKEPRPIRPKPTEVVPETPIKEFTLLTEEQKQKLENDDTEELNKTPEGEYKCSACTFKHENPKLLRKHEKTVHLKKKYLKCNKCFYVTHITARFKKHVKYHSMPMIKCDICDFRTPYKWNLDRHHKNHGGPGTFECLKCNFRSDIKQSMTVHETNHHSPPMRMRAPRRRRRIEISDNEDLDSDKVDEEGLEPFMEKEVVELNPNEEVEQMPEEVQNTLKVARFQNTRNAKSSQSNKRESSNNSNLPNDFIHPDDVVPRYGQIFVKNLKCKFCSYKAVFNHEIWRHEKRIHGYIRPDNRGGKSSKRPPPQLIPIQAKNGSTILKVPSVRKKSASPSPDTAAVVQFTDNPVNEKEFNEMCKKSSLTSSLKDIVFLIGDEEGLKTIPDSSRDDLELESSSLRTSKIPENLENKNSELIKQKQTDLMKKKNASFFDKLKEKLLTVNSEDQNLFCEVCGHESKCLSEAVAHQKRHSDSNYRSDSDSHPENDIMLSTESSSTRCQHCRQRCKTSTDLINHLKSCKAFEASIDSQQPLSDIIEFNSKNEKIIVGAKSQMKQQQEEEEDDEDDEEDSKKTSSENRVFVWNDLSLMHNKGGAPTPPNEDSSSDESLLMSPGYGTITSRGTDKTESGTLDMEAAPGMNMTVKKVFKCPHCSFWASTASRFHVHIVGHSNKKPFECSLCFYRSNWRWDITKHIRLKSVRDPNHLKASVNMTDETGRRNYAKYRSFLTMMRVQEPTAESSGYGQRSRSGEITQGHVTDLDAFSFPAPPKLTRAPTPGSSAEPSAQAIEGMPLRPPPPLKAAHPVSLYKLKYSRKKTLWKCKKCSFRNRLRSCVLAHVKNHYVKRKKEFEDNISCSSQEDNFKDSVEIERISEPKPYLKNTTYMCSICRQSSVWKFVIQRHCKLKHNCNAVIEINSKNQDITANKNQGEEAKNQTLSCDICPYTTQTEENLWFHKLNHVDRPGSIFKCTYCPFYVPSKIAVLEHIGVHGVSEKFDVTSINLDNFGPEETIGKSRKRGGPKKKYKCLQCPYVGRARTQFLYHKQFHRPRNSPFKCPSCSYNVTRQHLLHQHLRVHHNASDKVRDTIYIKKRKEESLQAEERVGDANEGKIPMPKSSKIPLMWVMKEGRVKKMYKCRWCPYISWRKLYIEMHEKMHFRSEKSAVIGGSRQRCDDCNYICSNAGALAAHMKFHLGLYGEVRGFVDSKRSDADQIEDIKRGLILPEPEQESGSEPELQPKPVAEFKPKTESELKSKSKPKPKIQSKGEPEKQPAPTAVEKLSNSAEKDDSGSIKMLNFCNQCPGRFLLDKDLLVHLKFHMIQLPFRCSYCTYTARQRPHLLSHYKVHDQEYQDETKDLMELYIISPDHPKPWTKVITNESCVIEGPVWGVRPPKEKKGPGHFRPKFSCSICPAKFFKESALRYHKSLHGANNKNKCKYCNYSVANHGNLVKHQTVHEREKKPNPSQKSKFSYSFTISGKDLIQEKDKIPKKSSETKNYKCDKCPSAFKKFAEYKLHLLLHGSKQRYRCGQCDYSVKDNWNFVRHIRKHEDYDKAIMLEQETFAPENFGKANERDLEGEENQIERIKKEREIFNCASCPYFTSKKHIIENHTQRHTRVSGIKSSFQCLHCDYSATQSNFLQEHNKSHFNFTFRYKAEAFLKCEKMELWRSEETAKDPRQILIFQDKGEEQHDRFYPDTEKYEAYNDGNDCKIYVDDKTGHCVMINDEPCGDDCLLNEDSADRAEKNKKRIRPKKLKCKKCPHAFGKKEDYMRHIELHGSNQKFVCDFCDYSVNSYVNLYPHLKLHEEYKPDRPIIVKKNTENLPKSSQNSADTPTPDKKPVQESKQELVNVPVKLLVKVLVNEPVEKPIEEPVKEPLYVLSNQTEKQTAELECDFNCTDDDSRDTENLVIDEGKFSDEKEEENSPEESLEKGAASSPSLRSTVLF